MQTRVRARDEPRARYVTRWSSTSELGTLEGQAVQHFCVCKVQKTIQTMSEAINQDAAASPHGQPPPTSNVSVPLARGHHIHHPSASVNGLVSWASSPFSVVESRACAVRRFVVAASNLFVSESTHDAVAANESGETCHHESRHYGSRPVAGRGRGSHLAAADGHLRRGRAMSLVGPAVVRPKIFHRQAQRRWLLT